ncbi:MAG: hypothetical protein JO303_09105 [Caulobacteraceae bacterium]|nr:hypothetical protein [Caulobacteraceae bacterium]
MPASQAADVANRPLGDFTADRRVLILIGMALVVGAGAPRRLGCWSG